MCRWISARGSGGLRLPVLVRTAGALNTFHGSPWCESPPGTKPAERLGHTGVCPVPQGWFVAK